MDVIIKLYRAGQLQDSDVVIDGEVVVLRMPCDHLNLKNVHETCCMHNVLNNSTVHSDIFEQFNVSKVPDFD